MLHMRGAIVEQGGSVAQIGPQGTHVGLGAKRTVEQPTGMQVVNLLLVD